MRVGALGCGRLDIRRSLGEPEVLQHYQLPVGFTHFWAILFLSF